MIMREAVSKLSVPAVVAAFGAAFAFAVTRPEPAPVERTLTYQEELEDKYAVNSDLSDRGYRSFEFLSHLVPWDVVGLTDDSRLYQARVIQHATANVFHELAAKGKYPNTDVNEYDLAREIIPTDTQRALAKEGINFVARAPIRCDVTGEIHVNPFNYSGTPNELFDVKVREDAAGMEIDVPLGTELQSSFENPFYDYNAPGMPGLREPFSLGQMACSLMTPPPDNDPTPLKSVY